MAIRTVFVNSRCVQVMYPTSDTKIKQKMFHVKEYDD